MPTIDAIYRYPVKGLAAERLPRVALAIGATLPADRLYAIENGPSGFDPAAPLYLPKQRFLMLMRNARLAELKTSFDETTHTLTVTAAGEVAARGDLRTAEGRTAIEQFFTRFCADELRGAPKVVARAGPQLLRRRAQSGLDHQSQFTRRGREGWPARGSIRCGFAPIFTSRIGPPGASSI